MQLNWKWPETYKKYSNFELYILSQNLSSLNGTKIPDVYFSSIIFLHIKEVKIDEMTTVFLVRILYVWEQAWTLKDFAQAIYEFVEIFPICKKF